MLAENKLKKHQQSLKMLFNPDQLAALTRRSTKGLPWQDVTVKKALKLRFSYGANGYQQILSMGVPLPSVRTLQSRLQKICFKPGLLQQVFSYLHTKVRHHYLNKSFMSFMLLNYIEFLSTVTNTKSYPRSRLINLH